MEILRLLSKSLITEDLYEPKSNNKGPIRVLLCHL